MTTPPPLSGETPPPEPRGTARPWLAPAIASGLALLGLGILLIPGVLRYPADGGVAGDPAALAALEDGNRALEAEIARLNEATRKALAGEELKAKLVEQGYDLWTGSPQVLGERAARELARGQLQRVLIQGERGYVIMSAAGPEAVLTVLARANAKLGLIFLDMRRAAEALARLI